MNLQQLSTLLSTTPEVSWTLAGIVNLSVLATSVSVGMILGRYKSKIDLLERKHEGPIKALQEEVKDVRETLSEHGEALGRISGMVEIISKNLRGVN